MATNFQLNVKAIVDSVDLQEQIKKIKIDPIKIQVDLGGLSGSSSGASNISSGLNKATDAAKEYSAAIDGMRLAREKNANGVNVANIYKSESDAVDRVVTVTKDAIIGINNYDSAQKRAIANASAMNTLGIRISGLTDEQNKLAKATERYANIEKITDPVQKGREIRSLTADINAASRGTNTFAATLQYMTERFIQIGMYVAIFRKLTSAIGDMIETVSSLDKSLVELRKVTDMTDSQLESFTKTAFEVGDTVARTGQEVIDAAAIFKRSGYEINEALDLSKAAMTMLNVGDNIGSVSEAATTLISVLKGYSLGAESAMSVTSLLNEVSNNSAINFADLAEGLTRTSAVFNQAGVSISNLSGLLTGANEILQNVEKTSSGLITISQRLRGITEISEDGYEGVSKLSKSFKSMAGIDIFDQQTGQLRDTYSILEDMAKVWPTLTKNQRQYLGEAAAGKRQINVLESLLQNWQGVEKAVKAATNSTGSAEKENSKYLNSIEGKTKAVESAMQKLASATVDDSLIKWFLDIEKVVVDATTSVGGLIPIILLLITAFSSKLVPALGVVINAFKQTKDAMVGAEIAAKGLSATGVFAAISLGLTIISTAVGLWNNYKNKLKEVREENVRTSQSNIEELQSLKTSYNQVMTSTDSQTLKNSKLSDSLDTLKTKYGLTSAELAGYNENLSIGNKLLDEQIEKEYSTKWANIAEEYKAAYKNIANATKDQDEIGFSFFSTSDEDLDKSMSWIKDVASDIDGLDVSFDTLFSDYNEFLGYGTRANAFLSIENKTLKERQLAIDALIAKMEVKKEKSESELDILADLKSKSKEYSDILSKNKDIYDSGASALANYILSQNSEEIALINTQNEYDSFVEKIKEQIEYTNAQEAALEFLANMFGEFSGKVKDATGYTSDYISKTKDWGDAIASLSSEIGNMDDAQEKLSKAVKEYNENGSLSYDTVKSLLDLGTDYTEYLILENGQLALNEAGIISLTEAKKEELLQDLKMAQASEISDAREQAKKDLFELHEMHLSGIETSERENEINATLDESIISITDAYGNQIAMVSLLGTTSSETTDELTKATEAYEKQSDVLDDAQSAYETLDSAIKEYNKNGVLSVDTLQSLLSLSPEYLQMFFDQAGALGDAEAATLAHAEALKQTKIQELQAAATADILNLANGKISSLSPIAASAIAGLGDKAQAAGNKSATAIPKVAGLAAALQAVIDASKGKLTGINLSDFTSGANAIADAYKSIANGISDIGTSFSSFGGGGGGGSSSKASAQAEAIANANKKLLDTTMKMIKAQKEDQIEVLEDELDLEEKLYKAEKKRLEDQIDKYKDVIDAKKKSLKLDKEQSEYDDEIADKNKEISDIQNRLTELEFDTSASAMAEKLKLQEDLTEKQKDLSNSQADREYDLTNQALDDDYEAYKTSQDAQIEILDQNFEATKTDYEDRIQLLKDYLEEEGTIRTDALNLMGTKSAEFYNNLFAWNAKYGDVTNATLQSIIDKAYEVVSISSGSKKSSTKKKTTTSTATTPSTSSSALSALGNVAGLIFGSLIGTHHDGLDSGFVGGGLKGNEEFIKALKGEVYATPKQQNEYMEKYLPNMLKNAYVGGMTNVSAGTTMQYDKLLEINVSGSVDSNSVSKIQDTVNQAFGQLTNALSQRGTVRKANAFAT